MNAYHNKPELKALYVERAEKHAAADEVLQNYGYWKSGKGCNIGCLAHANENAHQELEKQIGYPAAMNYLGDNIFEGLPEEKAVAFFLKYPKAAREGADLSLVTAHFMVWLLTEEVTKNFDAEKFPEVAKSCKEIAALYQRKIDGGNVTNREWDDAAYAAADAADAAAYAAAYAARAAYAAARAAACYERMADKLIELMQNAPLDGDATAPEGK